MVSRVQGRGFTFGLGHARSRPGFCSLEKIVGREAPSAYSAVSPFLHGFPTPIAQQAYLQRLFRTSRTNFVLTARYDKQIPTKNTQVWFKDGRSDSRKSKEAVMADLVSPLAAIGIGYNPDGALVGMAKQIGRPQTVELA